MKPPGSKRKSALVRIGGSIPARLSRHKLQSMKERALKREKVDHASISTDSVVEVGAAPRPIGARGKTDYSIERTAYQRRKAELLCKFAGEYVVFVGETMLGPFPEFGVAHREALRAFGRRPLYIKQVLAEEPIVELGAAGIACRS